MTKIEKMERELAALIKLQDQAYKMGKLIKGRIDRVAGLGIDELGFAQREAAKNIGEAFYSVECELEGLLLDLQVLCLQAEEEEK